MLALTSSIGMFSATGRWATALALVVALLVLGQVALNEVRQPHQLGVTAEFISGQLVVVRVQPASSAWDAGIRPGDTVVAVNGTPAGSGDDLERVASASIVESRSAAGILQTASRLSTPLFTSTPLQVSFLILALALAAVGATVFIVARDRRPAGALLALSTSAAAMVETSIAQASGAPWTMILTFLSLVTFGISTFLLFLFFPVDRTQGRPGRIAAGFGMSVHILLLVSYCWVNVVDTAAYDSLQKVLLTIIPVDLLSAIGLLLAALAAPTQRRQSRTVIQIIAIGTIVSFAPISLLSLLPYVLGFGFLIPAEIAILSLVLLPASIGGALVRGQFLGASRLIRRGFLALGVWVALLAGYAVTWNLARRLLPPGTVTDSLIDSPVLAVALIAATFPSAQAWLRWHLERALFRDVYDYAGTLRAISEELVYISEAEPIANHVLKRLASTLDLSWATIALENESQRILFRGNEVAAPTGEALEDNAARSDVAARIPLLVEATQIGEMVIGPKLQDIDLLPEDLLLLGTLAPMVATALQNAVLLEQLQEQVEILSEREGQLAALSSRLMEVHEEERARLALDLHDDPLQRALLLARQLTEANGQLGTVQWRQDAEDIVQSLKAICAGLRPPTLEDFGLQAGLDWLLDELGAKSEIVGSLKVETASGGGFGRLDPDLELALYRVGQEALNNCVKHSGGAQVTISLSRGIDQVTLAVEDDGQGYDPAKNQGNPGHTSGLNLGIMGMRERLRPWHGSVEVASEPGRGTVVQARVPLEEHDGSQN